MFSTILDIGNTSILQLNRFIIAYGILIKWTDTVVVIHALGAAFESDFLFLTRTLYTQPALWHMPLVPNDRVLAAFPYTEKKPVCIGKMPGSYSSPQYCGEKHDCPRSLSA